MIVDFSAKDRVLPMSTMALRKALTHAFRVLRHEELQLCAQYQYDLIAGRILISVTSAVAGSASAAMTIVAMSLG
jgi:hypothetical protein